METIAYIVPPIFVVDRQPFEREGTFGLSKHALSKARSQINIFGFKYGNTNSDVWKFIRADNSDKPWIREYSNTLRTLPRSRYKVIPKLTVPMGTTCIKQKSCHCYISCDIEFLRFSASQKTISSMREFSNRVNEFQLRPKATMAVSVFKSFLFFNFRPVTILSSSQRQMS